MFGILGGLLLVFPAGCGGPAGTPESRLAAIQADLDYLRNNVVMYDAQNKELTRASWQPLLDKGLLKEVPQDPWGHPYILDTSAGRISTLGADGTEGGTGEDADSFTEYKMARPKE